MMNKFNFLKIYFSPFKPLKLNFYAGEIKYGVPYFFPRRWVKNKSKPGYLTSVTKKIGFDFVGLGWKTKWEDTDYRFEYNPIWSFVFFKWQIVLYLSPPEYVDHYWECWLYYSRNTDKSKSKEERITQARNEFPCVWKIHRGGGEKKIINYWRLILKEKYL